MTMRSSWHRAAAALACAVACATAGAAGDLDTTFNGTGFVSDSCCSSTSDAQLLRQADGKLLVGFRTTGNNPAVYLRRYLADGALDTSFGAGGQVRFGQEFDFAMAQQEDGRVAIAVLGTALRILRLEPNGALLSASTISTELRTPRAMVPLGAGALAITGFSVGSNDLRQLAVIRLVPAGTGVALDTTFGEPGLGGIAVLGTSSGNAIAVQPDGKLVVAGTDIDGQDGSLSGMLVARFDAGGRLDPTFNSGAGVRVVRAAQSGARAVLLQPDGKIVLAGVLARQFALARVTPLGELDATFGNGGTSTTLFSSDGDSSATGLALQADGKLVAAGAQIGATQRSTNVARYRPDGALDETFAPGGTARFDFEGLEGDDQRLVVQPDGRLVLGGTVNAADFAFGAPLLARITAAGPADLALTLGADRSSVKSGGQLTYTLTVRNYGPDTAYDVALTDAVPPGTVFDSATLEQGHGSCTFPPKGQSGTVQCRLDKLFADASKPVVLKVKVTARGGSTLSNTASVTASGPDANAANNSVTLQTTVTGSRR